MSKDDFIIAVRVTPQLQRAINDAAHRRSTTDTEYVAQALIERLEADGFYAADYPPSQ